MFWEPELGRVDLLLAEDNIFKNFGCFLGEDLPYGMNKRKHSSVPRQLSHMGNSSS